MVLDQRNIDHKTYSVTLIESTHFKQIFINSRQLSYFDIFEPCNQATKGHLHFGITNMCLNLLQRVEFAEFPSLVNSLLNCRPSDLVTTVPSLQRPIVELLLGDQVGFVYAIETHDMITPGTGENTCTHAHTIHHSHHPTHMLTNALDLMARHCLRRERFGLSSC